MKLVVFVGDILASAGCYVKRRDEVGYDRDDVFIEDADEKEKGRGDEQWDQHRC